MNFYSIRDLRSETKNICEKVRQNDEVIITNNGKPSVLMLDISEDNFDEVVRAIRQTKAMIAFNSMKAVDAANGYMNDSDCHDYRILSEYREVGSKVDKR